MTGIKNRKGTTLIVSLIIVVVLLILGIAFTSRSIVESRIAEREKMSIQAFYIAEAGLERTLYELRKDFENDSTNPSWADGEINGMACGPDTGSFYSLPYSSTSLGEGYYSVELKNITGKNDEIWVRSTGIVGDVDRPIQAYIKIENIFPWNNVIFAGSGSIDTVINGNVDIRGSVLILGSDIEDDDFAIDMNGSAKIGNNYENIPIPLADRIPSCPTVMFDGEPVESLGAILRVKQGVVGLSGSATVGENNVPGNSYKETVDKVYVTDGYGGNKGETNVYSDNGTRESYDLGDSAHFPSLGDAYPGYPTYQDYLRDSAFVISEPAKLSQLANITPASNFSYGDALGSISMDGAGNLTINGIVYVDGGDLNMNKQGVDKTITYTGTGSILVTGDVGININLLTPEPSTPGTNTFPVNIIGIMTPNNITFNAADIDVMGIFYAEDKVTAQKQTDVAGVFVSNYFDMGSQVPSIYQIPEVAGYLPPGMIGTDPVWAIKVVAWQKL